MSKNQSTDFRHRDIIARLRAFDPETHPNLTKVVAQRTDDDLIRLLFAYPRINEEVRGGQLSKMGLKILSLMYTCWRADLDLPLSAKQRLLFGRACHLPYFICDTYIVTFDPDIGMMITLASGDSDMLTAVLS